MTDSSEKKIAPEGTGATQSKDSAQKSRLLELPPELRNRIYQDVLISEDKVEVDHRSIPACNSLLQTSRQIREEASSIFYDGNSFHATITTNDYEFLTSWLPLVQPRHAKLITTLELTPDATDTESRLFKQIEDVYNDFQHRRISQATFDEECAKLMEPIERCRKTEQEAVVDLARALVRAALRADQVSVPLASRQADVKVLYDGLISAMHQFQGGDEQEDLVVSQAEFDRRTREMTRLSFLEACGVGV